MIGATYRLQFRTGGVGFCEAAAIVPHLAAAGITHLYASPIFAATEGSTHGYDVVDHNRLDPALGGEEGFAVLCEALSRNGLALMLDIVPNHMAAHTQNPWWRDVLRYGAGSRYARHFDIDWSAPKLILPILGKPYGEALADGDLTRAEHPQWGPVLRVPGMDLPLRPGTEAIADVHACHEAQHYRCAHWRIGRDGLTYRRFFEVTGLVGVRVEDPVVFDDVHRTILALVEEGRAHALRVDHVDGLTDPAGYLERLAARAGVPVVVEKILGAHETLPQAWPAFGTTGYEFIAAMAALFVDGEGLGRLARRYGAIAPDDVASLTRTAKREILTRNLAGELDRLTALAHALLERDPRRRDHGPATVREGLVALMMGMDVYRTYIAATSASGDRAVLAAAREAACAEPLEDGRIVDDLVALLLAAADDPTAREFVGRFQQTTGPLMAKAVEDTLFFRHHRLLALNEVGGELCPELGEARYLDVARRDGLAATQTHDTKRGEDARARLYALSDPAAAAAWESVWPDLPGVLPDRLRWGLGQMLFASAPLAPDAGFPDRLCAAALKTVREAKEETSWTRSDPAFEAAVADAARAMAGATERLAPLEKVRRAGAIIGLSQSVLKMLGRAAPDIYQGTFGWDLSMVDPDNRRAVDFEAEAALCVAARAADADSLTARWQDGRIKARVLLEGLALRRERPVLFAGGQLARLPLEGKAAGAFAAFLCEDREAAVLCVVPRRPLPLLAPDRLALSAEAVGDLAVALPRALRVRITGERLAGARASLGAHFARFPVLLAAS